MDAVEHIRARLVAIGREREAVRAADRRVTAAARLATARALALGLSPKEIGELTGFQPGTVARWETKVVRAQRRGLLSTLFTRWWRRAQPSRTPDGVPTAYFSDLDH